MEKHSFKKLFEFSPDAIVVADHNGKIREVNAQVEKFFGYQRAELLGQPVEILIPERFSDPRHSSLHITRFRQSERSDLESTEILETDTNSVCPL